MTTTTAPRTDTVRLQMKRTLPAVRLLLYYGALVVLASGLIAFVPGFREALVAPITEPARNQVEDLVTGGHPAGVTGPASPWPGVFGRGALTLTAILWALAMSAP